ncbi:hypothetical protein [Clostridium kluyveri]|uniref:Uncharacterized protein n=1 Tax=Clostridium kluyveri TaxID=1534 RepID=A0A1L5FB53_CLOKL|nr:hypothetical protein [Clostridium kluyveri]APM40251.1 hypothetical protein BS101_16660 [Clostridium kluyveri]
MEQNKKIDLLEYKIKLIHTIITSMDNYKFDFFSFIIDHDITEYQTKLILKSLAILKDRLECSEISQLENDHAELNMLISNKKPSFKEFKEFIELNINKEINSKYLLMSLHRQKINVDICKYLLDDSKKQKI